MIRNGKNYQELPIGRFILCVPEDDKQLTYTIGMGEARDVALRLVELSDKVLPLSRRVREARRKLGESQRVFGARFGVRGAAVSLWETSRVAVPKEVERFLQDQRQS